MKFFFILIFFFLMSSLGFTQICKVVTLENGVSKKHTINTTTAKKIITELISIIKNVDEELRVFLDDERIKEIKQKEKVIEIYLNSKRNFKSKLGTLTAKKVLFALTGDLASGNESVIILLGEKEYNSSPHMSLETFPNLQNILNLINKKK